MCHSTTSSARDANLCERVADSCRSALPTAATAAATAAPAAGDMPGWHDGALGTDLPDPTAASTPSAACR